MGERGGLLANMLSFWSVAFGGGSWLVGAGLGAFSSEQNAIRVCLVFAVLGSCVLRKTWILRALERESKGSCSTDPAAALQKKKKKKQTPTKKKKKKKKS